MPRVTCSPPRSIGGTAVGTSAFSVMYHRCERQRRGNGWLLSADEPRRALSLRPNQGRSAASHLEFLLRATPRRRLFHRPR
jgi:hypothetical protein